MVAKKPLGTLCVLNVTNHSSLSAWVNADRFIRRGWSYLFFCVSSKVTPESRWAGAHIINSDSFCSTWTYPFYRSPHWSAKESLAGWNAMSSKANQWSCGALASQAEPRWLSRLQPWPLLSGVIILVLIQWLLQMRTHGLVLLQSPSENITEWLPQLGAIHGQVFPQKASPRYWLTAGFGWGHQQKNPGLP